MATFKDAQEREWEIRIDAPTILKIREDCDPEFLLKDTEEDNTYQRMQADPVLLCRVIYLLCDKQRQERGLTEEQFYMGVIGDAIDRATEAMLRAIVSFIPRRTREFLEASAAKQDTVRKRATELALAKINDPDLEKRVLGELERSLDVEVERLLTRLESATSSPASSVSNPTDSRSAN